MYILIKNFPSGIAQVTYTAVSTLYIGIWEVSPETVVFVQLLGSENAYKLEHTGYLVHHKKPEEGVVCEVVINHEEKNLKTSDLVQLDHAFRLREILGIFLARLGFELFSMEFKKMGKHIH